MKQPTVIVPSDAAGVGPMGSRSMELDTSIGQRWEVAADDGSIMRSDFDGRNVETIVPAGGTFPETIEARYCESQIVLVDREGMRVMRASFGGSNIETLVMTGSTRGPQSASRWCVGIAIDAWRQAVLDSEGRH
jgi:hypothetical protein